MFSTYGFRWSSFLSFLGVRQSSACSRFLHAICSALWSTIVCYFGTFTCSMIRILTYRFTWCRRYYFGSLYSKPNSVANIICNDPVKFGVSAVSRANTLTKTPDYRSVERKTATASLTNKRSCHMYQFLTLRDVRVFSLN